MSRIQELFSKKKNILSLYVMAGFPALSDTVPLCRAAEAAGAELLEIGIPFSDPVADGPTIQRCSEAALKNGMTLKLLFDQIATIRESVTVPLVLMGYINPVLQYGMEKFCADAARCGIDGVILPDLPLEEYLRSYRGAFEKHGLTNIFLITARTAEERIRLIDEHSRGFVYVVSSEATTGGNLGIDKQTEEYFARVRRMELKSPIVVGFGISNRASFNAACKYAGGAIVASAFLRGLEKHGTAPEAIRAFVSELKGE